MNKKLSLLSLIPFFGWFIVVLWMIRKAYKQHGLVRAILYYFLSCALWFVTCMPYYFIHTYLIWPIGKMSIVVTLVFVVFYVLMVIAALLAIFIIGVIDKKLTDKNENNSDQTDSHSL